MAARDPQDGPPTSVKRGGAAEWGGYLGYFTDPDGHLWEITHNPAWPLDGADVPRLP